MQFWWSHELLVEVWYALVLTSNFALYLSKGTTVWTVFIFGIVPHHYMLCNSNEVLCEINYSWYQTVTFIWTKGTIVWTTYVVGIFLCHRCTVPSEENVLWNELQLVQTLTFYDLKELLFYACSEHSFALYIVYSRITQLSYHNSYKPHHNAVRMVTALFNSSILVSITHCTLCGLLQVNTDKVRGTA